MTEPNQETNLISGAGLRFLTSELSITVAQLEACAALLDLYHDNKETNALAEVAEGMGTLVDLPDAPTLHDRIVRILKTVRGRLEHVHEIVPANLERVDGLLAHLGAADDGGETAPKDGSEVKEGA